MPFLSVDGIRLHYRLEGRDDLPTFVFSHSLRVDHGQWDAQVARLRAHYRILRYDTRGHGASDAPSGDYSIQRLGGDVLALADGIGLDKFAFRGLSLGGMIGQWPASIAGSINRSSSASLFRLLRLPARDGHNGCIEQLRLLQIRQVRKFRDVRVRKSGLG